METVAKFQNVGVVPFLCNFNLCLLIADADINR